MRERSEIVDITRREVLIRGLHVLHDGRAACDGDGNHQGGGTKDRLHECTPYSYIFLLRLIRYFARPCPAGQSAIMKSTRSHFETEEDVRARESSFRLSRVHSVRVVDSSVNRLKSRRRAPDPSC